MTKELEALEKIKRITSTVEQGFSIKLKDDPYYKNELSIIENALQENERLKTSYLENLLNKESKEYIYKKLKALEFFKNNLNIEFEIIENRCFITIKFRRFCVRQELPKQEFDLLKEVLL